MNRLIAANRAVNRITSAVMTAAAEVRTTAAVMPSGDLELLYCLRCFIFYSAAAIIITAEAVCSADCFKRLKAHLHSGP